MSNPEPLNLPKLWTFQAESVIEALVLLREARGKEMPGMGSHDYDLHRTTDGEFVLTARPRADA